MKAIVTLDAIYVPAPLEGSDTHAIARDMAARAHMPVVLVTDISTECEWALFTEALKEEGT